VEKYKIKSDKVKNRLISAWLKNEEKFVGGCCGLLEN
jgi:methionine synthase I (cobalamin-dependent)